MSPVVGEKFIICGKCRFEIDRIKENKHCSNCIVCTGCEIYYCPKCDEEIIITPIKPIYSGERENLRRENGKNGKKAETRKRL